MLRCPSSVSVLSVTWLSVTIANGKCTKAFRPNNITCCGRQASSPLVPKRIEELVRWVVSRLLIACSASSKDPCPVSRSCQKFSSTTYHQYRSSHSVHPLTPHSMCFWSGLPTTVSRHLPWRASCNPAVWDEYTLEVHIVGSAGFFSRSASRLRPMGLSAR